MLPVTDRQLARSKFPDHHTLARQTIRAGSQLASERLACCKGARVVLGDHVDGPSERERELRREACRAAPAHAFERKDVGKAVAQQKYVCARLRLPGVALLV